ncbi:MAG: DMT family transporter [Verrucomicrobiia bacterium]
MLRGSNPLRQRATRMLVLATLFWGISFPVMKAIGILHHRLLEHPDSWFATSSAVAVRFGIAAVLILAWSWRTVPLITKSEMWQGFGLGLCAGLGMLLQVDGLRYTSASSSAFLTQCGCLFLPWVVAIRDWKWPSGLLVVCSVMAVGGVAVLADVDWRTFSMGRGEVETLMSSAIFTAQILWLERPRFRGNRVSHFSLVMFVVMTMTALPVALLTAQRPSDWAVAYGSMPVMALIMVLVVCCTLVAFTLMNRWQPILPAPEAGLIYAAEPVFASLFALFLPLWLSRFAGIDYPNETATVKLLTGGGLITLANVLIQVQAARLGASPPQPMGQEARDGRSGEPVAS